jgi:hypothetical protein
MYYIDDKAKPPARDDREFIIGGYLFRCCQRKDTKTKDMEAQMKTILRISLICLIFFLVISINQAQAGFVFEAHGTASDGRPDNGQAVFSFTGPDSLSIILENTAGPSQLSGISSVLDGIQFHFSSSPSKFTLTGANASGKVTVTSGVPVFSDPGISQNGSSPFGWTIQSINSNTWLLSAGNGSFKPYGIVNSNITGKDGLPNNQHNPYLDGPVTFSLKIEGLSAIPQVDFTKFYFGTRPDIQNGSACPVPIPPSLFLLAPGLLGLVGLRKRIG